MATDVVLPQWGMNMQEGTVVRWLKQEGDAVSAGDPLVEIETAKINSELESPAAGVLRYIVAPEGVTVPVNAVLAIIAAPDEAVERPAPAAPAAPATPAAPAAPAVSPPAAAPASAEAAAQVVPAARRLAREQGIDLATVRGSGPGGRILEDDVRRAVDAPAEAPAEAPVQAAAPLTGMRRTIAERMLRSVQTMAQVTLTTESDVTAAVELRKELVGAWREHRLRPVDQDLVVKAVARALREHPHLNATLDEHGLRQRDEVNVGVALALDEGLLVGVVRDADRKDLLAVAREIRALAEKARAHSLEYEDVSEGTFTISPLAQFDVDAFTPIVNPPEVAILGVGRIVEKPAVVAGEVTVRSMTHLSLTFDHRAVDGAPAAQFLQAVTRHLADPRWMTD